MIRKQYTAHHKFILCKRHEEKYVQVHYYGVTMVWFLSFRYHSILWLFVLPSTYKTFIEHFFTLASLYYYLYLPLIAYPFLCVNFNQQDSFDIIPAASHLQKRISNVTVFTPCYIMHSNLEINYVLYINFAHLAAKKMHLENYGLCIFFVTSSFFCESFCTKSGVACLIIPL